MAAKRVVAWGATGDRREAGRRSHQLSYGACAPVGIEPTTSGGKKKPATTAHHPQFLQYRGMAWDATRLAIGIGKGYMGL